MSPGRKLRDDEIGANTCDGCGCCLAVMSPSEWDDWRIYDDEQGLLLCPRCQEED